MLKGPCHGVPRVFMTADESEPLFQDAGRGRLDTLRQGSGILLCTLCNTIKGAVQPDGFGLIVVLLDIGFDI
jgi:hypothetical protein